MNLEHEAVILDLVVPDGIDGGIVYEDPHLRLSEVLAVVDSFTPLDHLAVVLDEYFAAFWPVPEGVLSRKARIASILARLATPDKEPRYAPVGDPARRGEDEVTGR